MAPMDMVLLLHSNNNNNIHLKAMRLKATAHHNHNIRMFSSTDHSITLAHAVLAHNSNMVTRNLHSSSTEATLLSLAMYVCENL